MIRLEGLHKQFGPKLVLRGLDLEVKRGETMVIIGRSGEGKSVLLKCLLTLLEPDSGKIWFGGQDVLQMPEKSKA